MPAFLCGRRNHRKLFLSFRLSGFCAVRGSGERGGLIMGGGGVTSARLCGSIASLLYSAILE